MNLPRVLLFSAATLSLHAAPTLTDLGTLGGNYSDLPFSGGGMGGGGKASSYSGSVLVGSSSLAGNNTNHAFIYSGGVMTDLGTLGGNSSNANGISANGSVVIGSSNLVGNNTNHAFIYSGGVMTDLGTLGGDYSYANGISANGSVVIGYSNLVGNNTNHAFIYSGGVMTDLGTLGGDYSNASGISANGSVVIGYSSLAGNNTNHAFIYSGGVMTDLGTLGGNSSNANGISANGSVVIGSSNLVGNNTNHAFIYSGGVMTDLGTLGGDYSYADGISANGSVVIGYSSIAGNNTYHAFIYSGGVMTNIGTLLVSAFGNVTGSRLFGVSDDGLVAAGYYSNGTGYGGFYYKNGVVTDIGNLGGTFSYAAGVSGDGSLLFGNSNLANGEQRAVTLSLSPVAPTTISTTITASDTRVTGGNTLQFQGGTLAPVGAVTLNLASGIEVLASSTGTLDATSQNISSSGAVTISGTSLTLTGSTTSAISLAGLVSGAGGLINVGGVNTLAQGSAYTGATVVSGGKLIQVGTSQSSSNQIAAGATLEFNQASGIVSSGNTTFNGAGILLKTGAGSLGWGVTSATFSFSRGAMIHVAEGNFIGGSNWSEVWTDNHSDLRVDAGARFSGVEADVRIDRLLGAGVVATGLGDPRYHGFTIGVDGGDGFFTGTIIDSDTASGDLGKVVKVGAGELTLTGSNAYSGGTTLQAGALRAGNNAAFGSGTITLNAGVLSSDGSAARTLANVVHIAGAVTLGDAVKDGALTLAGAVSASSGTVVTFASDVILSGTATSTGVFTKAGTGALTLDAAGTIATGTLVVSGGLLTNNGLINGVVTVASAGTLGGSGTIAGTVTVAGILAPGNSPGLLTQTTGDLNLTTGSHFLAELGGTTAGNGNGFHDQYFVSNGAINIANGVTLDVKSWLAADGITTFAPVRTNVFSVLKASNGIAGVFSDFTNADYSQWLLFDNSQLIHSPGNLYGTGLNGNQTFAAYGTTAARAAVGASLWAAAVTPSTSSTTANPAGFIYAGSSSGAAAIGLLTAVDADAYLAALSPEAYLAAGDYALTIARSVSEAAFGQASLIKTGDWTLGAGYNRTQHGYRGADATSNYELSGNTSLVTLTRDFGPHCSVGFFFGYNTGKTVANNANLDYRGNVFGLTSVGRYEGKHPVTLKAAVVSSDIRFDAVRNGSTANDQTLRSLSGQLTASLELYKEGRLTFSPLLGFVQGRSTSDAFAEAGSGARLNVNALERKSARGLAGLGATYILSNDLQLDFAFAYEYEFADAPTAATASFVDAATTVPMTIEHALVDRSTTSGTLGANWKIDNSVTLRLSAEARGNRELHKDYRYNVGLNVRF